MGDERAGPLSIHLPFTPRKLLSSSRLPPAPTPAGRSAAWRTAQPTCLPSARVTVVRSREDRPQPDRPQPRHQREVRLRRGRAHGGNNAINGTLERISTWSGRSLAKTMQAAASASVSKVPSSCEVCRSITVICGGQSATRWRSGARALDRYAQRGHRAAPPVGALQSTHSPLARRTAYRFLLTALSRSGETRSFSSARHRPQRDRPPTVGWVQRTQRPAARRAAYRRRSSARLASRHGSQTERLSSGRRRPQDVQRPAACRALRRRLSPARSARRHCSGSRPR